MIQRGANGFFCAVPKGGKSWAATDMAISLALGCPWLGFNVPKPIKVAFVSREDAPELTSWRIRNLLAGKCCFGRRGRKDGEAAAGEALPPSIPEL